MRPDASGPDPTARRFFQRRGRIVFTLLAVLVVVGLTPLGSVAWKLIDINREALSTAQQEFQHLLTSSVAHEFDIHIEGLRSQLLRVAQTLGAAMRGGAGASPDDIATVLDDVLDERMLYLRYTYFSGAARRALDAGTLGADLDPVFERGLREAAEVLVRDGSSRAETTIVSEPILLDARPRRTVMVVSAPVVSGGRFRGVLSGLVDVSAVWQQVVARNRTGHLLFALDKQGRVVASANPARAVPGTDVSRSALVLRYLKSEGRAAETMPFLEIEDGEERQYIGSYEVTALGWGVFVQAPLHDVYQPIQRMVASIKTWATIALGIAVLAAIVFAGTLSRPINRLAAASRRFAAGDFSTRVEVRSTNEIGELASTFNRMAGEIEDHIRRLRRAAEENRELFLGTIRALAQAIDAKDPYTRGHSVRVNRYSVILARELGLSDQEVADIHVASLMHDVGKIGIHDVILQKPGKLTEAEFEIMKTHTTKGAQIMAPIRQMTRVIPGLRSHHERWKGGGYPDGLAGDGIPLMARVIAVADSFDAMTTHRPYQSAMTFEAALETLNRLADVAFDRRVVDAFNRAWERGLIVARSGPEFAAAAEPAPVAASS